MQIRQAFADRFHFGFCNACERYACGESTNRIMQDPCKDVTFCPNGLSRMGTEFAVRKGAKAACEAINGKIDLALNQAKMVGLSDQLIQGLKELVLSA